VSSKGAPCTYEIDRLKEIGFPLAILSLDDIDRLREGDFRIRIIAKILEEQAP
jgi:hypothetical protein